jgi:phosphoglycerate dehydrogenase-like enzyme
MKPTLTILDDYQGVALKMADWTALQKRFEFDVVTEHISDIDALAERLRRSEVVVAMRERTPFPATLLARLPELRLLITTGMGNASFDLAAAQAQGITVCGTGGAGNGVVELTIGMMVALTRSFAPEDRAVRDGGWQHTIGPGLAGHTLGVVGLGRLGGPVARVAQALQMDVVAWSPHLTEERAAEVGARAVSKDELFASADLITIHMPLAPATRGLIGAADLARMKRTSYLINTSRGPIVDEAALIEVLAEGRIAGAGLDVYDTEPLPAEHPLRRTPNTLLLPHIGYVTTDAYRAFYGGAVDDITSFYAGSPVRVLAAPER